MITIDDILETNRMITENKLDVRTITMGISLRGCAHPNIKQFCDNVYDRITTAAEFLVKTGEDIEAEYGIPIIHKRVSVTPIAIAAEACKTDSYVPVAEVSTLRALAYNMYGNEGCVICPIMDARRQEVYTGAYEFVATGKPDPAYRMVVLVEEQAVPLLDMLGKFSNVTIR